MRDLEGREWRFRVTALTVRDIQSETRLDPRAMTGEKSLLVALREDAVLLLRVLWLTIRDEADKRGVTEEQWLESLDDSAIEAATMEWTNALIDFFPPARRELYRRAMNATTRYLTQADAKLTELLKDPELDARLETEVSRALQQLASGTTAASSPASSE